MATRMLIDARHPEETRVAVLKGNRIEEFDFESADRKQIKGNIYLAKVTRVEPSLQAAFVDFGGNRHGFLAFSEIHPDYYQIPKEDREALLAEEAAHAEEEAALRAAAGDDDGDGELGDETDNGGLTEVDTSEKDEVSTIEAGQVENGDGEGDNEEDEAENENGPATEGENGDQGQRQPRRGRRRQGSNRGRSKEADELRTRRMALRRRYKIQDVIHRRQVLLVQVVKEERGNKGAALTTYLSLAGRYCVLMPNSSHGGGISRKISSVSDRKRLKAIINELNLPKSMGCIVRTAGLARTKTEIKRDFDYLARLWDELRETTLKSAAPTLIHSDSDLIKRAIRDIYNRDIEEVIVEGEEGYKAAKAFMKLLMPSHARRVKPYSDPVPLFQRYGAEDELRAMYDPVVQLRSGGYVVINPTEALVSIDINSGRATKEHGIEATALNTNLEAAHEVARQLRLRDMAGLVVIDFIDMEYGSNVRKVEKAMKEALKTDRARIQVGRISSFGLMEMSRQRLRTGVLEATTRDCPHCDGTGLVRTASSAGLSALRQIEDEAAKGKGSTISLYASTEAAVYLLNSKRADLVDIESRYGVQVEVIPEGENEGAKMRVTSSGPRPESPPSFDPIVDEDEDEDEELENEAFSGNEDDAEEFEDDTRRKPRKARRGRGRDRPEDQLQSEDLSEGESDQTGSSDEELADENGAPKKRRRRGGRRRRGRGRGGEAGDAGVESQSKLQENQEAVTELGDDSDDAPGDAIEPEAAVEAIEPEELASADEPVQEEAEPAPETGEPAPRKRSRRRKPEPDEAAESEPAAEAQGEEPEAKPKRRRRKVSDEEVTRPDTAITVETTDEAPEKPKRTRRKKTDSTTEETPADKPKRTRRKKTEAAPSEDEGVTAVDSNETPPADAENTPDLEQIESASSEVEGPSVQPDSSASEQPQPVDASAAPEDRSDTSSAEPPRRGWWQRTFGT